MKLNNMKSDPVKILIGILVIFACLIFVFGIGDTCYVMNMRIHGDPKFPISDSLLTTITSIAAVLTTNLGAILGFKIVQLKANSFSNMSFRSLFFDSPFNIWQVAAAYIYVICLISITGYWIFLGLGDTTPDNSHNAIPVIPLITQFGKTFIGVVVGALAVSLSVNPKQELEDDI